MTKTIYSLSIIAVFFFTACKKTATIPDRFDPIASSNTNVKFIDLSPDAPPVNFFTNGAKASSLAPTGTNAVNGMGFAGFYPSGVAYTTLSSGSIKIDVKVPDSSAIMPGAVLLSSNQTFDANKFYTLALVDSVGSSPKRLSTVISEDDPTVPDPSRAYIRISNYIANGAIKVEVSKTSVVVGDYLFNKTYASIAAKTVLPFDSIGAGAGQVYKFVLKDATSDIRLDSIVGFAPANTKKYSIYARGVIGLTGTNTRRPIISSYVNF